MLMIYLSSNPCAVCRKCPAATCRLCRAYSAERKTLTSVSIRSMERLDESGQVAEPGSQDRARWPLWHDEPGAAFEESQPDRRQSSASPSSSPSSASTQLPGAGCEERPGSPAATDAEQAVDPTAETGQHQLPQAERLAYPRTARHGAERTGPRASGTRNRSCAASASAVAYAAFQHAAEPSPVELRAGCRDGPRRSTAAQPGAQRLQQAAAYETV